MKILRTSSTVQACDLRRSFGSRKVSVEAVAGVDLDIEQGSIFGFLGPNGAGKTTTLRMLSTLLPPTSGEARVAGFDLRRQPQRVREHIGYVSQQGGTDSKMTGRAELIFQGRLYGLSGRESTRRASEVIAAMELTSCADRAVQTYSGGQRRRLDVALGLVNTPSVLFLDEPTSVLTRRPERICGMRSGSSKPGAPRFSSPPTTSTRRMPSAIGSPSSTMGASSLKEPQMS